MKTMFQLFVRPVITTVALLLVAGAVQPVDGQSFCLMCDYRWESVDEWEHRFDSAGDMQRSCQDGDCHNNWRDGSCATHPPCGDDEFQKEEVLSWLDRSDPSTAAQQLRRLVTLLGHMDFSPDGTSLELRDCTGDITAVWRVPLSIQRGMEQ